VRAPAPQDRRRRLVLATAGLLLAFLGLAARAAHLSLFDERGSRLGRQQSHTVLTLAPERGTIFDRNGHELALSVEAPSVYAVPSALEDPTGAAGQLARALGRRPSDLSARLRGRNSFVFLARWVTPERADRVRALDLRGVGIVEEPGRTYPYKELAAQLVGFANIDGRGVRGVEQQEDAWLQGTPLRLPVERDGSGGLLVDRGDEHWSTAGGDVRLSLDVAMQSDAMLALREAVQLTGARGGVVVTLEPASGDLLALAETPSFDPNRFRELRYADTRSRAFLDALEPGSTFKAFLIAAALEIGTLSTDDLIDCENGQLRLPGKTIRDMKPHGALRSADVLRVSSNVGAVKIAFELGPRAHVEMLRRFGFGSSTGSGFPDESSGLLRTPGPSRPVDHATLAFGQGLGVTTVQLAAATAALANGGHWVRPRLVQARRAPRSPWQPTPRERVRRVVAPQVAATLLGMLEGVAGPDGTGRRAALRGVRVAGKTGTAQKFDTALGRYSEDRFVAWFIGMAPADDPRLVLVVALDEPRRPLHTGGAAAAPLFARVAAAQLARLGILTEPAPPPRQTRTAKAPAVSVPRVERKAFPELTRLADRILLPDLQGLTVAEVRAVTAKSQLHVEISGNGRAVAQDPPPGTVLATRGTRIQVRFEPGVDPR
jgi:cell division protein FtsI (penicillin-binding protein 3)